MDSIENPIDNFQNNAFATLNLLNACAKNKVKKFVMASTGGALMGNCELPVDEKSIPNQFLHTELVKWPVRVIAMHLHIFLILK